jgi:hypothetical protein
VFLPSTPEQKPLRRFKKKGMLRPETKPSRSVHRSKITSGNQYRGNKLLFTRKENFSGLRRLTVLPPVGIIAGQKFGCTDVNC